jgi:hypothetical protein
MKALVPQPSGEVAVEHVATPRPPLPKNPTAARQLRVWIVFLCLAWGFLGFLGGTWFGSRSAERVGDRAWYHAYADRLAGDLGLDRGQHARLVGYLSDYDRRERECRAAYALSMERDRRELAALGNSMYRTLLEEIVIEDSQRERLRERLIAGEKR